MSSILITRSGDEAGVYADIARARNIEVLFEPMLNIEALTGSQPDLSDYQSLVFTSGHALEIFVAQSSQRTHKIFTVGDTTADKARAAGFTDVTSASGTADDLIALLNSGKPGRALYFCGEDIAHPIPGVDRHVLYKAHPVETLSGLCEEKLRQKEIAAALFFSVRGARAFAELIRRKGLESSVSGIKALCLSAAVLESVSVLQWLEIKAAATPDREGMKALLAATLDG